MAIAGPAPEGGMTAAGGGEFPELLIASDFAPNMAESSCLMRPLLQGYPARQLNWWAREREPARKVGQAYHQLYRCGFPAKLAPIRRATVLKSWCLEAVWVPWAAAHLRRVAKAVAPGRIWVPLTGWMIPVLWRSRLAWGGRCHVSIWDYHDTRNHLKLYGASRARRFTRWVETMFQRAASCDVVSHPMWEDMVSRTGRRDALVLHSGFEAWQLNEFRSGPGLVEGGMRIAHAGSIQAPEAFRLFVNAVERLRSKGSLQVALDFFGTHSWKHEPWFNDQWMREHGVVDETELIRSLRRCSWGFLAMELSGENPRYNRFSFPNKMGTYLSAGLPLLVLAHPESSAAKMMGIHPVGVNLASMDQETLTERLSQVFSEPDPKRRYYDAMLRCAETEFNMEAMRRKFWQTLGVNRRAPERG